VHLPDFLTGLERPVWRGRLHAWAFVLSLPLGVALVIATDRAGARVAVGIYALSLAALFGISSSYHLLARSPTARRRMRRLDHSMIYVLIAGTYTPVCLLGLPLAWGIPILAVVWGGAVFGVLVKGAGIRRLTVPANILYIVMGWAALLALPVLFVSIPPAGIVFMVIGGVAYTYGATVLARRRPDPSPRVFGFHEIWHACTIVGALSHYAMIWRIAA
jgi:hemolysin III